MSNHKCPKCGFSQNHVFFETIHDGTFLDEPIANWIEARQMLIEKFGRRSIIGLVSLALDGKEKESANGKR